MNLFSQSTPTGLTDVLGLPLVLFVLALGIWYAGLHIESRTEKSWPKWVSFLPISIGLIIGIQEALRASDYVYQQTLPNAKTLWGHYAALGLPVFASAIIIGWYLYLKRSGAYDRLF